MLVMTAMLQSSLVTCYLGRLMNMILKVSLISCRKVQNRRWVAAGMKKNEIGKAPNVTT